MLIIFIWFMTVSPSMLNQLWFFNTRNFYCISVYNYVNSLYHAVLRSACFSLYRIYHSSHVFFYQILNVTARIYSLFLFVVKIYNNYTQRNRKMYGNMGFNKASLPLSPVFSCIYPLTWISLVFFPILQEQLKAIYLRYTACAASALVRS
jgi:hypothetical protein